MRERTLCPIFIFGLFLVLFQHHLGHMKWTIPAGTVVNQTERVIPEYENELDPIITGETTKIYKVKAMIFQESVIRRKGVFNCNDAKGSWIVSPQVPKTGNAKIIMEML